MAESPTPETGTPESQSPARTPPALITTEELLQSMVVKSPEAASTSSEASPGGSVARQGPPQRYESLRIANALHKLQDMQLPPEQELRAAALGGRPAVGPPPRLPHQLSPALQSVLVGWRSVYENCRTTALLQRLVGECYAQEAVFEDALVSARGQEAVYRQFAMLGAAVQSVQVGAYSLSVTPLSRPRVQLAPGGADGATAALKGEPQTPPRLTQALRLGPEPAAAAVAAPTPAARPAAARPLHLTRVTVENVQCFNLGLPPWLSWLAGGKEPSLQVHLYVTSILLVASDAPLAVGPAGEAGGPTDVTATRLEGAVAALGGGVGPGPAGWGSGQALSRPGMGMGMGMSGPPVFPCWRIVHHVDIWHNVPLMWWRLRRALCVALDALLSPLLGV